MPVQSVTALAVGDYDEWSLGAGGSKVSAVQSNDGDTSYITAVAADLRETFTLTPSIAAAAVASVSYYGYYKWVGGAGDNAGYHVRLGGNETAASMGALTNAYTQFSALSIARPGGGSWGPSDLTTYQAGPKIFSPVGWNVYCTEFHVDVDYTPPSGGFAFLLGLAGLMALPYTGVMDYNQFTDYCSWFSSTKTRGLVVKQCEVLDAWRDVRWYKYPSYYF